MKDVHTEHCCAIHGCKYNDKDCTVMIEAEKKNAVQSYPCEHCYGITMSEIREQVTGINSSIAFIKNYCDFSDPDCVWMLKGVSRNKDNKGDFHKFMRRLVIAKPEDIEQCYYDIKQMGNRKGTSYRIYISLNSRNVIKGMFHFQKKLLDISHGVARGLEDMKMQTTKLGSVWKTELEHKGCRGTKRVLLDVDNSDELFLDMVLKTIKTLDTKIHVIKPTVSGYAVVIEACDMRPFYAEFGDSKHNAFIDVQHDSMVFVEKWEGKT